MIPSSQEKETLIVSFSGGKTSAFMCYWLITNYGDKYNLVFCFANTGREHEETLIFVKKCDEYFKLNLVWVEAVINPKKGIGPRQNIVDFDTACRDGKVFESFIAKEGIPNTSRQHCTDRLKTQVIRSWMRENGTIKAKTAIGMRGDEPKRCDPNSDAVKRFNLVYPLAHWGWFDKQDVNTFWESMPFNLELPEHYGTCVTCFKKSDPKLHRNYHEHPEWFEWHKEMEAKYQHVNAGENDKHVFFRGKKDTSRLIRDAQLFDHKTLIYMTRTIEDYDSGCGEECHPYGQMDLLEGAA
jgi:3'-phosphoadenosine 5'-phosphosulfate sulfotransferase (PAPS reductase)/FAD synthetase